MEDILSDGIYKQAFVNGLKPEEILTVSEWADKYRNLSEASSAEPGRWRTSRTPYLKDIMDSLSSHHPAQEIIFMKGAQVGATEAGINWLGYIVDHIPAPTMVVQPTVDMAKRNSKQRIQPMINDNPRIAAKIQPARSKDSGNTVLQKDFPGGTLLMAGANSAVGLRSMPAKNLFLDEVDGYPGDIDGEGDPIKLATARQRTFPKRKRFLVSTPTVHGLSKIEPAFMRSDQRYFNVPCPHCDMYQKLVFKNLIFDKDNFKGTQYLCDECGVLIDEHFKGDMLSKGKWVAENPGTPIIGFHLNSLYSPLGWYSWDEVAQDWIEAHGHPELLKGFINTVLGETWKDKGEVPDWERLYERRTTRELNIIPEGGLVLTCGVDVQKDRLELEIVAWGRGLRSWSIDFRVLPGDTADDEVWKRLDEILIESWPIENSRGHMQIKAMAIDSGYNTQRVYSYVRTKPRNKVFAVKGSESLAQVLGHPKAVDINWKGKRISRGIKLWHIGVSVLKSETYSFLRQARGADSVSPIGYCDFPEYAEEYFKQLTAEELVIKKIRGYNKPEWVKVRDRNEALDCRVMARAMATMIGIERFKDHHFEKLEKANLSTHNSKDPEEKKPRSKRKIKRRESSWL